MLLAQATDVAAGTPWTAIMAVVTTLAGAVSVLFGMLNTRMSAQLASAEKRATDAEARCTAMVTAAETKTAALAAELAAERASRLAYVQQLLDEERAARRDLETMQDDQQTLARSEDRGAFGPTGASRQSRPDTGPQRIRGGGGPLR